MSWQMGLWLFAVPLVALLGILVLLAGSLHNRKVARLFSGHLFDRVLPSSVRARRLARDLLAVFGLVGLVLAMAEPLYGKQVREVEKTGVDIVIAVDLSRSMDATDVDPSRLERARREIFDLIELLQSDRVGLVIYAGGAWPRMPLTLDYDALRMMVEELDTSVFSAQGSEVGEALRLSGELLSGQTSQRAGRAVLLLSDGESHNRDDALAAAKELADDGIRIYTMGVGVEPAPIPLPAGGWITDNGRTVLTEPDPELLRDLARVSGGAYVQSVAAASDMQRLYADEIRATLEAATFGSVEQEVWQSGFQWPLGVGLVALLLSAWLGDGRRPWGGAAAVLLGALLLPGSALAGTRAEGDAAYRDGRFIEAEDIFTELVLQRPDDADLLERLAAARYRQGDYDGAARAWDQAAELSGDPDDAFNSGGALHKAGRLEEARRRYDEVLNVDREHPGARHNQQVLAEELRQRHLIKPPPPEQQDGQSDEQQEGQQQDGKQGTSESQDGKQGEPGEPGEQGENAGQQPGEQSEDQEGLSEQAPDQEGQAQDGQAADSDQSAEQGSESKGTKRPGEDGQELDEGEGVAGAADPSELDDQGDEPGLVGEPFDGSWEHDGPVTEGQAERLFDAVEEGQPRIRVPGRDKGKPW